MSTGLLHHIELYVSDLKKSTDFWGWFLEDLGYHSFQKWEKRQNFKLEETYIVFVQVSEPFSKNLYHRKNIGLNHLAFHARSRQHVDEMTKKLRNKGISILYTEQHPFSGGENHCAVYFEDPDGIKVELVAPESF
ncbi:MAG: VOC family protein [Carnobacterium sp.]|nr:VOC family protein [Carnobacterium sp.]